MRMNRIIQIGDDAQGYSRHRRTRTALRTRYFKQQYFTVWRRRNLANGLLGKSNNKPIVTMVLPLVATAARRRVGGAIKSQVQRRAMGGGPAKEWEGIDKVVRGVFPGDHQRTFGCRCCICCNRE